MAGTSGAIALVIVAVLGLPAAVYWLVGATARAAGPAAAAHYRRVIAAVNATLGAVGAVLYLAGGIDTALGALFGATALGWLILARRST